MTDALDAGCNTGGVEDTSEAAPPQVTAELPQATVRISWVEAASLDPVHINQAMVQIGNPVGGGIPDGIYVAVGSILPPILDAGDEAALRQAAQEITGSTVKVTAQGRFHMSRDFLGAMIKLLQQAAEQYDASVRQVEASKTAGERG